MLGVFWTNFIGIPKYPLVFLSHKLSFKEKSLAIFKRANFAQNGLQKYEQPTKNFCLTENLGEYFFEIKLIIKLENLLPS